MASAEPSMWEKLKSGIAGITGSVVAPLQKQDSPIAPLVTQDGAKMVGMGSEPSGYTSGGGRRLKTRSASKNRRGGARKTRSASKKRHTKKH
jgi:hypothetical protein